jgi:hypothetical protein
MADKPSVEGRTAYIEKNMKDGVLKDVFMGVSKIGDAVGYTQEDKYKGKTKEEIAKKPTPEKKRAGGYVKAADGCAQRGKTRGRMV